MKQPCGARRTPPDGLPGPLKPNFRDFERGVTRIHGFGAIKKTAPLLWLEEEEEEEDL